MNSRPNSTLALLPFPVASGLAAAVDNISSLKRADWPLRLVSCRPMMSQPISWYTSRTSAALPTPCFPSTAIVRTLWVAMTSSLLRARSRSLLACRRAARRLVLLLLLFFLANTFFLLIIFCTKTSVLQFLPPFAPEFLVSRGGFGFHSPRRLAHLTRPS